MPSGGRCRRRRARFPRRGRCAALRPSPRERTGEVRAARPFPCARQCGTARRAICSPFPRHLRRGAGSRWTRARSLRRIQAEPPRATGLRRSCAGTGTALGTFPCQSAPASTEQARRQSSRRTRDRPPRPSQGRTPHPPPRPSPGLRARRAIRCSRPASRANRRSRSPPTRRRSPQSSRRPTHES